MSRLILLNGAPSVGKSTLARRWANRPGSALVLDVDLVRALLGDDGDPDVTASWLAARALALAMADTHLRAGHDVVVPQYLGRPTFIAQLESVACATDSAFVEIVLDVDRAEGQARFERRGDVPQLAGATESYGEMHDRLGELSSSRPDVIRVDAHGDVEATLARLERAIEVASRPGPGR